MSIHLSRRSGGRGRGGRKKGVCVTREGQERLLQGVPHFALLLEAFLLSFLLPFERRVRTK